MDTEKKLRLLENVFELNEGEINPETELDTLDNWDSITQLSLIIMIEENFNKLLTAPIIKKLKTVGDIMTHMEHLQ